MNAMNNQYQTLSEATSALEKRGYEMSFVLKEDRIHCEQDGSNFNPSSFHIDEYHRFEGMTNPGDMSVIYAISTDDGRKGVLIDAYGTYSDPLTSEMLEKMRIEE